MPIQDLVQKWKLNPGGESGDGEPLEGVILLDESDTAALAESLGDQVADVGADPRPARRSSKPPKKERDPAPKANAQTRREVRDAITMMISMPAGIWAFRDSCGAVLLEHADNIAAKLTPIVCRNPALLAWFTTSSAYMDWFALFTALAPVARAVWDHHVVGPREGVSHAGADGSAAAEPAADFSQFAAPVFSG